MRFCVFERKIIFCTTFRPLLNQSIELKSRVHGNSWESPAVLLFPQMYAKTDSDISESSAEDGERFKRSSSGAHHFRQMRNNHLLERRERRARSRAHPRRITGKMMFESAAWFRYETSGLIKVGQVFVGEFESVYKIFVTFLIGVTMTERFVAFTTTAAGGLTPNFKLEVIKFSFPYAFFTVVTFHPTPFISTRIRSIE